MLVSSSALTIATNPVLRSIAPYGLPSLPYASRQAAYAYPLLVHHSYVSQYNPRTRNANWVIEVLNAATAPTLHSSTAPLPADEEGADAQPTPSGPPALVRSTSAPASLVSAPSSAAVVTRELSTFRSDPALLPSSSPSASSSFTNSSFDRGHLVPAADCKMSQQAMDDSFLLTNVSPQHPRFNRGYWRALESWVRSLRYRWRQVLVISGPLWLPDVDSAAADGSSGSSSSSSSSRRYVRYEVIPRASPTVSVPTHFFKIVLASDPVSSASSDDVVVATFVLPNAPIAPTLPLTSFMSSLSAVQHSVGFTFFPLLQPELELPSTTSGSSRRPSEDNRIDLAGLLVESNGAAAAGGGVGSRGGLTAMERRSLLELCAAGGCDLTAQWKEIAAWDDHNRRHKRNGSAAVSQRPKAAAPDDAASTSETESE